MPERTRRRPLFLVRALTVVTLVQVLLQAALAGGFISGSVGYLTAHSVNGSLLVMTVTLLGGATILLFRPGRGPWWPIVFSAVLWWLVAIQVGIGFSRQVGLHIPLGALIMVLLGGFTWWSMSYRRAVT